MFQIRCLAALICASALSGCGGTPLNFTNEAPFGPISDDQVATRMASYDRLSDTVLALSPTSPSAMDESGRATFTGLAELGVSSTTAAGDMTLVGDAVLIANFQTRVVTASMNNFAGADMAGAGQRLDGSLEMDNGAIGFVAANGMTGTFRGRLVADEFEIVADGVIEGTFRDTPTSSISFTGLDDTALLNGERARLTLTGVAQD